MAKAIGTLGNIDSITVGGRTFTDLTNLITLVGYVNTNGRNATFKTANNGTSYLPSSTKKFVALAGVIISGSAAAVKSVYMGYSDTDVGFDSATGFTNLKAFGSYSSSTQGGSYGAVIPAAAVDGKIEFTLPGFEVPNGKYTNMTLVSGTDCTVYLFGYEA